MEWDSNEYPRRRSSLPTLLLATLFGIGIGVAGLYFANNGLHLRRNPIHDPAAQPRIPEPKVDPDAEEIQSIHVNDIAKDSVVNVDTLARSRFDTTVTKQIGSGSGFIWDEEGRIVTNYHVIAGAIQTRSSLRVVFSDRSAYEAKIVGFAADYDLAVLQVDAPKDKIKPIKIGTSKDLKVGQKVFAIGNPFGLSLTMTKGIISALDREIDSPGDRTISGAIQTDAPINPGNSGGPLLDKDARLIGVNASIATADGVGGNVGIGFAIPVDTVNDIVPKLIAHGKLLRPDIGIKLVDQRILVNNNIRHGAMVGEVVPGGPADKAGLKGVIQRTLNSADPGDLILAVDGSKIANNVEFLRTIARKKIGDTVKLTVERDNKTREVEVTISGI